jgi:hypothetical protein
VTALLTGVVREALGVVDVPVTTDSPSLAFEDVAGLALRDNPRRAHLIVSKVLGKHIPVSPEVVLDTGYRLADEVGASLRGATPGDALVIGYCETATGLGHAVAERLGAPYLHTTRRPDPTLPMAARFDEEHSHAVSHFVQPGPGFSIGRGDPLVLVDDELTTGRTALNTIEALHAVAPRSAYVVAVIIDARTPEVRAAFERRADALGLDVSVVSLCSTWISLPDDVLERAGAARAGLAEAAPAPRGAAGTVRVHEGWWPPGVPLTARHGMHPEDTARLIDAAADVAKRLVEDLGAAQPRRVLVLGTEELLHLPTHVAAALAELLPDAEVVNQSTTRSPVHAADTAGYAVRRTVSFAEPHDADRPSHLHNVVDPGATPADGGAWADLRYDRVVVVADAVPAACGELVEALRPYADVVHLVALDEPLRLAPAQPGAFGSYDTDDVTWLLTDLSAIPLERGTEDREESIQSGVHYSEMLPIEYQPSDDYVSLFHQALALSADRLATAVGIVGELIWEAHGSAGTPPVLVSLARAGTPIGVLLRRYLEQSRGVRAPHYTISIIRGRGIDEVALATVLDRHPVESVVFVDGWTGKGAIQRELTQAVAQWRADHPEHAALDDRLAVLADPGSCTPLHGTRDDFLIPSACLNSTVSGLVSRTVHRADLIRPGMFHGAKYYADLARADVSRLFVDTIADRFPSVASAIAAGLADPQTDRTPTWAPGEMLVPIARDHGVTDLNLVKPGVGETTRVLLRRVPWRVLYRPDRAADLAHVFLLAEARNVPIEAVPDLGYSCVGLIRQLPR